MRPLRRAIAFRRGAANPPPARGDLAAGVPAPGRQGCDRRVGPDPRRGPGRAEADRASLRAGVSTAVSGECGQDRAPAATGAVDGLRASRGDARHAGAPRSLHDLPRCAIRDGDRCRPADGRRLVTVRRAARPRRGLGRLRPRAWARPGRSRPLHDNPPDPAPATGDAPFPHPAPVPRRFGCAARVVPLGRVDRRPGRRARLPRSGHLLPDADGDGCRRAVEPPRPRRLSAPGVRVRGVGLALGPAAARALGATRDASLRGPARPAAHGVGARRRLRPHPRR